MTTEAEVSPGVETEIHTPVAAETPEITAPETQVETQAEPESEEDKGDKAIKAMQKRIDRRTRDLYAERAQREQLEREVAALRQPKDPAETTEVDVEALATKKAAEIAEQRDISQRVQSMLANGKALEGFEGAVSTAVEDLGLLDSKGKPTALLKVFLEADAPHEVLYHLGRNPDVAGEFDGLTPTQAARRLAKLEVELEKAKAPKVSAAPKPLKPVNGGSTSEPDPSAMTDKQFAAWRKQQIAARRA
jgi:hypothetical protein